MNEGFVYDVAIIGGGLAGLTLAIQCADKNYKVILFEKEEYPFHKVCGEYISLESRDFLNRLTLPLNELNLPLIKTLIVSDTKGDSYSFNLPLGGFGISRFKLDNLLYQIALQKGVSIYTNCKVTNVEFTDDRFIISAANMQFFSKVAAGTFGKRSNLDIKWRRAFAVRKPNSLNNFIGIKYHVKYPHNNSKIALHNFYNGYCGLSKIEEDKSCLCYLTTAKNLKDCGNSIPEMQKQILYKNRNLKEIFSSAQFLYDEPLAISQVSFNKKTLVENHVLMLGDAAGMISPLCGNGMSMAMHSGKLAMDNIDEFLNRNFTREQMEKNYEQKWKGEFSKRLIAGRIVQRFFGGNTSASVFLKTMHAIPALANQLIKSTHGKSF